MTPVEFQERSSFGPDDIIALTRGDGIFRLPGSLLLPFHEITRLEWDGAGGTGRMEAVRHNRLDDWFYACHFMGDPVMPGCWGVDAVWQCLKFFAAWRGLSGCDKTLGMENVSFFGQIRPHDEKIVYAVEVQSIEQIEGESLVTGRAAVSVDGCPVYSMGAAQVGTAYWESGSGGGGRRPAPPPEGRLRAALTRDEFKAKSSFSRTEILALSQGTLVEAPSFEMGLLPSSLMLEIGEVSRISYDENSGEGRILAAKRNSPLEWFYAMDAGAKPAALTVDAVWQLLGLFLAWRGHEGTGRALGLERVEVFDAAAPSDREIDFEVQVLKVSRGRDSGEAVVMADARVFADGRPLLKIANAKVGCHKKIRYSGYPRMSEMALGGALKTRTDGG